MENDDSPRLLAEFLAAWDAWRDAARLALIQQVVDSQAEDDGLWFEAVTAPEAYLQQELRRLHRVIEEGIDDGGD